MKKVCLLLSLLFAAMNAIAQNNINNFPQPTFNTYKNHNTKKAHKHTELFQKGQNISGKA